MDKFIDKPILFEWKQDSQGRKVEFAINLETGSGSVDRRFTAPVGARKIEIKYINPGVYCIAIKAKEVGFNKESDFVRTDLFDWRATDVLPPYDLKISQRVPVL